MTAFFRVRDQFVCPHKLIPDYPLLPGDILVQQADGTFDKTAPGLGMCGFEISKIRQLLSLEPLDEHPPITFM